MAKRAAGGVQIATASNAQAAEHGLMVFVDGQTRNGFTAAEDQAPPRAIRN
jgi:hypothetical protein